MKKLTENIIVLVLAAGIAASVQAETLLSSSPSADDLNGSVSITQGDNGSVTLSFPEQSSRAIPRYDAVTLVAGGTSGEMTFVGDYPGMGVENVSFEIVSGTTVSSPIQVQLVLRSSGSGRVWRNEQVAASAAAGDVVINKVTFDRSSGWTRDGGGDLDSMWAEDVKSVEVIGVRLAQPDREGRSYTISSFSISGATFGVLEAELTPFEQALLDKFGVTTEEELTDVQKAQDGDGDGMTDLEEIRMENDDEYANSIFLAEIVKIDQNGILIRWPCVVGSSYTVIRSASLLEEFQDLPGAVSLDATYTGFMTHLDEGGLEGGPYFYKIRRE